MGAEISLIRKEIGKPTDNDKMKQQEGLQILEKMVTSRLNEQEHHMIAGERGDQEIHTGTIVEVFKQVNIQIQTDDKPVSDELEKRIDNVLSGDAGVVSGIISGLAKIVDVALNTVLGNESMGEYEKSEMFVVWRDNALLRYDVYCYRWNFAAKGVIQDTEGVSGVLLMKRVIDLTKTDPQVLTWAISRQARALGDPKKADDMIKDAMKVLKESIDFQSEMKKMELEHGTEHETEQ